MKTRIFQKSPPQLRGLDEGVWPMSQRVMSFDAFGEETSGRSVGEGFKGASRVWSWCWMCFLDVVDPQPWAVWGACVGCFLLVS